MSKFFKVLAAILLVAVGVLAQSGTWGTLTWEISDGTLTISGEGAMPDDYLSPWRAYQNLFTKVIIDDNVTSIGRAAFAEINTLTEVVIGNSVTSIGNSAFDGTRLNSVIIPNSVTSIGDWVFRNISTLTEVEIGNSVTSIGYLAFLGTSLTSVIIPNSVTSIGGSAFSNISSLTEVVIGNSVTNIGSFAFFFTSLTSVIIPNSVVSIGGVAFAGISTLTDVEIGNSVTSIGAEAFRGTSLTSVVIPNSVTSIGGLAFSGINTLTDFWNFSTSPQIGDSNIFGDDDLSNATLYVPISVVNAYRNAFHWRLFGNIKEIQEIEYTGTSLTIDISAFMEWDLVEGADYTAEYFDNIDVGAARIEITGKGEHSDLNRTIYFLITKPIVNITWENTALFWNGQQQAPTPISDNPNFPVRVTADSRQTNRNAMLGLPHYTAEAELVNPAFSDNVILQNTSTTFTIGRRTLPVEWDMDTVFIFNGTLQFPNARAFDSNREIALRVIEDRNNLGNRIRAGKNLVFAQIANPTEADNYILCEETHEHEYEILRRPINILLEADQAVGVDLILTGAEKDTIVVDSTLFADSNALKDIILDLVGFYNFVGDDSKQVFTGEPTIRFEEIDEENPSPAPRSSLDLLRYRIYLLTIDAGGMTADNYRIADTTFVIRTTCNPTFIRNRQANDSRFGIVLENAVVSDFARISVVTPEPATVNLAILDNLGNVVFSADTVGATASGRPQQTQFIWNLTNQSGRFVANGAYLVVVEATGISGKRYTYSARIGVNR